MASIEALEEQFAAENSSKDAKLAVQLDPPAERLVSRHETLFVALAHSQFIVCNELGHIPPLPILFQRLLSPTYHYAPWERIC